MVDDRTKVKFYEACAIDAKMVNPQEKEFRLLPHIGNANIEKHSGKLLGFNLVKDEQLVSGKYYFNEKDVLYGKINPQFAKVAYPQFEGLCSADMYPIRTKDILIPQYLKYLLLDKHFTDYTISVSMRSGMPKVNREELGEYIFELPQIREQEVIANILCDIDNLIQSLEKQLLKKMNLYKGISRKLIVRSSSNNKYIKVKVSDIALFMNGKAHENEVVENGIFILVNSKFISSDGIIRKYTSDGHCVAKKNDVLMVMSDLPNGKAIAKCYFVERDNCYTINQRICILRANQCDAKYLYYITNRHPDLLSYDDGVKQTNLRKQNIMELELCMLKDKNEQQKVAKILSGVEEDIHCLSNKIEKYKLIKQGMMQDLLTGKRRLI